MENNKLKIEIELENPLGEVGRQWLLVELRAFLHWKWKAYEPVGDTTKIQVRFIEE